MEKSRAQTNSGGSEEVSSRVARCKSPLACDLENAFRMRSQTGSSGSDGSGAEASARRRPCGEMVRTIPMRAFYRLSKNTVDQCCRNGPDCEGGRRIERVPHSLFHLMTEQLRTCNSG